MGKRIFTNDAWEELAREGEILSYGTYHKYRLPDGSVNPDFRKDIISGLILDVKEKKERALNYFYNALSGEIEKGVAICVVPSHSAGNTNQSGIAILARRLASSENRIDMVDYILRSETIDKLATGGERSMDIQKKTLAVNPELPIADNVILVVDDVSTSGNSLMACRDLLLENGAERVAMFALGKSIL